MKKVFLLFIFLLFTFFLVVFFRTKNPEPLKTQEQELLKITQDFVKKNSVPGLEFELRIRKQVGKWALVEVVPKNKATDEAAVILEKVGDPWIPQTLGTIFPV